MPQHKHYYTYGLTLPQKRGILLRAKELCYDWRVDKLDCSVSMARQKIDMTFEKIMKNLHKRCLFNVIHRKENSPKGYLEISFCTMNKGPDLFLWLFLDAEHIPEFEKMLPPKPQPEEPTTSTGYGGWPE